MRFQVVGSKTSERNKAESGKVRRLAEFGGCFHRGTEFSGSLALPRLDAEMFAVILVLIGDGSRKSNWRWVRPDQFSRVALQLPD